MIYVSTRAGKRHTISEDAVLVGNQILTDTTITLEMPSCGFVCVADGVGGNKGGAQASGFVLRALSEWEGGADEDLKSFLDKTNSDLIAYASGEAAAPDMATTLTGFCFAEGRCKLVHIGNTRAYIQQGKYLKQLTSDHTVYQWLRSSGQAEAAECCNKNEITNCFGGSNPALISKLCIADIQPFSLALLTSDGVHDYIDLDALEAIVSGDGTFEKKCEKIVCTAVEAGSEDDLSAVILCPPEG